MKCECFSVRCVELLISIKWTAIGKIYGQQMGTNVLLLINTEARVELAPDFVSILPLDSKCDVVPCSMVTMKYNFADYSE